MNTTNIFEAFLRGEPKAFNSIYFTYQYPLTELARRLLHGREDPTADVVSDAFRLLLEKRTSFKSAIHIQRLLYLVVRRNCKRERWIQRQWFTRLPAGWDKIDPDASEQAILNEFDAHNQWLMDKLLAQLTELPEQRADDLREYYFNYKSFKDITQDRGVEEGSVRRNVELAMDEIQKYLQTNRYPGYSKKS